MLKNEDDILFDSVKSDQKVQEWRKDEIFEITQIMNLYSNLIQSASIIG